MHAYMGDKPKPQAHESDGVIALFKSAIPNSVLSVNERH